MRVLPFILLIFFTSSCSYAPTSIPSVETKTATIEASSSERQPVYIYGQKTNSKEIMLHFGGEPVAIACGYIKLTGTIRGGDPLAVIEVGGRGEIFKKGEKVGNYVVADINEKEVRLWLKK